jgi:hypothetical protein
MSRFPFIFEYPRSSQLWRFIDFTKLISILGKKELKFVRADQFEDPFEGAILKQSIQFYEEAKNINPAIQPLIDSYLKIMPFARIGTFISCWHINDSESAAMWKLYTNSYDGIAVVTQFDKLDYVLSEYKYQDKSQIVHGQVTYANFDKAKYRDGNTASPFMFKRDSFKHENEFRAILQPLIFENGYPTNDSSKYPLSIGIPIEPNTLFNKIVVAPYAPNWVVDLVQDVINKYDCIIPVEKSLLFELTDKYYEGSKNGHC